MLPALNRRIYRIPVVRTGHPLGTLFLRSFTASLLPRRFAAASAHDEDDMATPDGKVPKASAVTLKTPKGTRDWSGQDMLLREEVLYVLSSGPGFLLTGIGARRGG